MALLLVTFAMAWVFARGAVRRARRPGQSPEAALLALRRSGASVGTLSLLLAGGAAGEVLLEVPPLQAHWWLVAAVVLLVGRLVAALLWFDQVIEPIATLRGVRVDRDDAFMAGLRALLVRLVPTHVLIGVVLWLVRWDRPMPVVAAVVMAYAVLMSLLSPWLVRCSVRVRPATACEQDRVDELSRRHDLRVGPVRVIEPGPLGGSNGFVVGIGPSGSRIHLTQRLLDRFDDADLAAILAHEVGHRALHHLATRLTASLLASLGVLAVLALVTTDDLVGLGVVLAVVVLFPWVRSRLVGGLAVRQELEADAYAARRVGPAAVRGALERLFADNLLPSDLSNRRARRQGHPSLRRRLERLGALAAPAGEGAALH